MSTKDLGIASSVEENSVANTKSVTTISNPNHDATKGVPAYFTDGEMLPWKNRWFRVTLLEVNGEKIIGLHQVKPTASAIKREERMKRWQRQHPQAEHNHFGQRL